MPGDNSCASISSRRYVSSQRHLQSTRREGRTVDITAFVMKGIDPSIPGAYTSPPRSRHECVPAPAQSLQNPAGRLAGSLCARMKTSRGASARDVCPRDEYCRTRSRAPLGHGPRTSVGLRGGYGAVAHRLDDTPSSRIVHDTTLEARRLIAEGPGLGVVATPQPIHRVADLWLLSRVDGDSIPRGTRRLRGVEEAKRGRRAACQPKTYYPMLRAPRPRAEKKAETAAS